MADIRYNTRNCKAKIHYVEAACIGAGQESATFVRTADSRGSGFIKETTWGTAKEVKADDVEFLVPVTTLPRLLEEFGFPSVDILKIDAEGVEGEILALLRVTGWMRRVHWIRGEWHGQADKALIEESLRDTHVVSLQPNLHNGELIAHNREDA
jgi:FkbM family methyltransferase